MESGEATEIYKPSSSISHCVSEGTWMAMKIMGLPGGRRSVMRTYLRQGDGSGS